MHKYHRSSKNKETKKQTKGKKVRHTNKQVTTQINKRTNKENHIVFVLTSGHKVQYAFTFPNDNDASPNQNALIYEHGKKISRETLGSNRAKNLAFIQIAFNSCGEGVGE